MSRFKQAAPDPDKAARDGVANYIPSRSQPDTSHRCVDCERTATWEINSNQWRIIGQVRWRSGKPPSKAEMYETRQGVSYACDEHRMDYVLSATNYQEKRLR